MSTLESSSLTFVVRVWVEGSGSKRVLRGHVTHVQTGDRRHFTVFGEVVEFMELYVAQLGTDG